MRKRLATGLVAGFLLLAGSAAAQFLSSIQDLPLMPGLSELAGEGLVFDKPGGRIVEAYAEGPVTAAEVARFYGATLPQLGWRAVEAGRFRREGERLDVEVLSERGSVLVRFTLRPE